MKWMQCSLLFLMGCTFFGALFGTSQRKEAPYEKEKQFNIPPILFLKGSPYELGYQHGQRLKDAIAYNVKNLVDDKILANPEHPQIKSFLEALPHVLDHVPKEYQLELKGLAEGAEISYEKILLLNLLPEMFHCTGMTLKGQATKQQELYHVRVLDYAVGKGLQKTAVVMVVESAGKIPFLNVSYAGFIGSVTGMNAQHIAVGEIGGKGYGHYEGMPMAFLLRSILEKTSNLQEIRDLLATTARTCEYYYVFSDGKNQQSMGVYATGEQLDFIEPGTSYALFDSVASKSSTQKVVLGTSQIEISPYQTVLYQDQQKHQLGGLIHRQPVDCLVLIGFCHPQRYPLLIQRILERYGTIDAQDLQEIIKTPVARPNNLHNAIFAPTSLEVWIAHAGSHDEPACDQPYQHFNLAELLRQKDKP